MKRIRICAIAILLAVFVACGAFVPASYAKSNNMDIPDLDEFYDELYTVVENQNGRRWSLVMDTTVYEPERGMIGFSVFIEPLSQCAREVFNSLCNRDNVIGIFHLYMVNAVLNTYAPLGGFAIYKTAGGELDAAPAVEGHDNFMPIPYGSPLEECAAAALMFALMEE